MKKHKCETLEVGLHDGTVVRLEKLPHHSLGLKSGPVEKAGHMQFSAVVYIPFKSIATITELKKRRQVRFPGICEFAKSAKVTRIHAYRVLTGERRSPRLEKLWSAFLHQHPNP
jgi:hypothetical protein